MTSLHLLAPMQQECSFKSRWLITNWSCISHKECVFILSLPKKKKAPSIDFPLFSLFKMDRRNTKVFPWVCPMRQGLGPSEWNMPPKWEGDPHMGQLVKHLPFKHKDPEFNPRPIFKKPGIVIYSCNPSTSGITSRQISWTFRPASPASWWALDQWETLFCKKSELFLGNDTGGCPLTYMCTCTHTHIHEHTQRQGVTIYNQRDIQSIWFSGPEAQTRDTRVQLNINHRVEEKSLRGNPKGFMSVVSIILLFARVESWDGRTRD